MSVAAPRPFISNPLKRIVNDLLAERAARRGLPAAIPGLARPSPAMTFGFVRGPLRIMLDCYERYGPVFSIRLLHSLEVFLIGAEATHFTTVSGADNFHWRDGGMGELIPLIGDGLLTTDGEYHHRARKIMLPAFHHEHVVSAGEVMVEEALASVEQWQPGQRVDLYGWARRVAMRVAMRALFGFDPDESERVDVAGEFASALSFYGNDLAVQALRGPFSPFARMQAARARLDGVIFDEIARRRREGGGEDVLSLLLDACDEGGFSLDDRQLRDQVMTLLFAGHDTTTSTVAFLFYELARNPWELARLREELWRVTGGSPPTVAQLVSELPMLEQAVDETLRLYPPAWIGPRRAAKTFEFHGVTVPAGLPVNYSSWATHHLPELYEDPETFRPQRMATQRRASLPKGAYAPFGAGSRICIGMRFGHLEVKAIAAAILRRFDLALDPGWRLEIRQTPTLGPRAGLPMQVVPVDSLATN